MKKIINLIIAIGVLYVLYYLQIRPDYVWDEKLIEEKTKDGWQPVSNIKTGNLMLPWTWFATPISDVFFVKKDNVFPQVDNLIIGQVQRVSVEGEVDEYFSIIDCQNKKSIIVNSVEDYRSFDKNSAKWNLQKKGNPGWDILEYCCKLIETGDY